MIYLALSTHHLLTTFIYGYLPLAGENPRRPVRFITLILLPPPN